MGESGQGLALAIPTASALQFWQMAEHALSRRGSPRMVRWNTPVEVDKPSV